MEDTVPGFSHNEDLFLITALNFFHLLARIFLGATASSYLCFSLKQFPLKTDDAF